MRVPKLRYTAARGMGWHVCYRDPTSNVPRKHRFRILDRAGEPQARVLYHAWVAKHLGIDTELPVKGPAPPPKPTGPQPLSGSLIEVASSLIEAERIRVRQDGDQRMDVQRNGW